jgi:RNA polymerase subunit RPABC4/transcription elongation factor Spt4
MNTEETGVIISAMCYNCVRLTEVCPDCVDQKDTQDIAIAHQLVDEGNAARYNWNQMLISDLPSGHDWTERDGEFKESVSMLIDRLYDLETSLTITSGETICQDCHLVYNKYAPCPNCN